MSKMRSSSTLASTPLSGSFARRDRSTGRMTSPMRSGRTMLAMKPMLVADTSGRSGGTPTACRNTRQRWARMNSVQTVTGSISTTHR